MKTIEEIKTNYAVEQGYYDWNDLINAFVMFNLEDNDNEKSLKWIEYHENTVIQLIQYELKKKIHIEYVENDDKDWHDYSKQNKSVLILNTENIK